jgi:hypothetical protein
MFLVNNIWQIANDVGMRSRDERPRFCPSRDMALSYDDHLLNYRNDRNLFQVKLSKLAHFPPPIVKPRAERIVETRAFGRCKK